MDKKQCHQCHKELEVDTVFCSRCGTKVILDVDDEQLDLVDIYRAVLRLENQLKQHNISPEVLKQSTNVRPPVRVVQANQNGVVRKKKKKKSSFSLTSAIITILIILIIISISFIGTIFVNVHASGYTKTSGEVVNELLDMFQGDNSVPIQKEVYEEVQE